MRPFPIFPPLPWGSFPSTEPPAALTQVHLKVEKEIPTFSLCSKEPQRSQTVWHRDSSSIFKAICNNQPLKALQGLIRARACSTLKSTRSSTTSFNGGQSSYSCKEASKAGRIFWKKGRNKEGLASSSWPPSKPPKIEQIHPKINS